MLTQAVLDERLHPRPVRFFQQVASTQDIAHQWLYEGAPTGAVVIADEQVAGRGRRGRGWVTPPGTAIALSVILHPEKRSAHQVTMLGALSIAEMLDSLGLGDVSIKWPNDVLLTGRKVCGVLPEAVWEGDLLRGVVLGIGINVRVDFSGSPLAASATSIEAALGQPTERADLIARLLARVDHWSALLGTNVLFEAWQGRLSTLGQQVAIADDQGIRHGLAERVTPDGALLIRQADGTLATVTAGELASPSDTL
ncbi:biotin--[acetyl-CoA-carboxylase] ligase [bacterium]|nr:biotin--[acetyl-CoA-carboxylase] ligase [bacterium]